MPSIIRDWNKYINRKRGWVLVTSKGEIVESFRSFSTALAWKPQLDKIYIENLKIKKIEDDK